MTTDAMARAEAAAEKAARLEAQLMETVCTSHQSEVAELRGQLCQLANGAHAMKQRFKAA